MDVLTRADTFDPVPALRVERSALLTLLQSLPAAAWAGPTECPSWSVKGICLHLVGDDLSLLSRQRDRATDSLDLRARSSPQTGFVELLNGFNDAWVDLTDFFSTEVVIDLLRVTGQWTEQFYATADPDALCEPMHWGEPDVAPIWRLAG